MRVLLWLVMLAAVLWGGWWWFGARTLEREAAGFFAAQEAAGRVAHYESVAVQGFPNRLDLTVTGPVLYDPWSGWGWRGPFAQMLALSYRPWHVIAALPPGQVVTTPFGDVTVEAGRLRASVVVVPGPALTLDRVTAVGEGVTARGFGQEWRAEGLRIATRQSAATANGHDLGIEAGGLAPDPAVLAALPAGVSLPGIIDSLRLDLELALSAPIDRHAGRTRPEVTALRLREVRLVWGDMAIHGTGQVGPGPSGLAEGRIGFRVTDWRAALAAAVAAGLVAPETAPTWERALALLAASGDDPDTVDLPLYFQFGMMSLGPIPLGPAPRLR
ncbi:MAG: DUF2125 domain-containing protein [Gemmobacter sp.]